MGVILPRTFLADMAGASADRQAQAVSLLNKLNEQFQKVIKDIVCISRLAGHCVYLESSRLAGHCVYLESSRLAGHCV